MVREEAVKINSNNEHRAMSMDERLIQETIKRMSLAPQKVYLHISTSSTLVVSVSDYVITLGKFFCDIAMASMQGATTAGATTTGATTSEAAPGRVLLHLLQ